MNDKELIAKVAFEAENEYLSANESLSLSWIGEQAIARYLAARRDDAVAFASPNGCTSDLGPGYKIKGSEVLRDVVASSSSPVSLFLAPHPDTELVKLLKDDAYAMTFQSIGQYRSALIKAAGVQQCD